MSWIRNAREAREAAAAKAQAPQWTGEAWRTQRTTFAAWFRTQAAEQGVPFSP